jgi:hypothetical protein
MMKIKAVVAVCVAIVVAGACIEGSRDATNRSLGPELGRDSTSPPAAVRVIRGLGQFADMPAESIAGSRIIIRNGRRVANTGTGGPVRSRLVNSGVELVDDSGDVHRITFSGVESGPATSLTVTVNGALLAVSEMRWSPYGAEWGLDASTTTIYSDGIPIIEENLHLTEDEMTANPEVPLGASGISLASLTSWLAPTRAEAQRVWMCPEFVIAYIAAGMTLKMAMGSLFLRRTFRAWRDVLLAVTAYAAALRYLNECLHEAEMT